MRAFLHRVRLRIKGVLLRLFYFKDEQALLRGKLKNTNKQPPVAFFTVHKAGSSLLSKRFSDYFRAKGYTIADLSSYFAKTNPAQREVFFASAEWKRKVFAQKGVYHSVFRYPTTIPQFSELRIILVLRDPRDVLVSHYFSTRYSHPVINMDFFALKKQAEKSDIDEYTLLIASDFRRRYEAYLPWIGKPNVLFLRYEDMIADPATFEERFRYFVDMSVEKGEIVSPEDFQQEREDPRAHKRHVQAGDHKNKLKPATIAALNQEFERVLEALNYEV